MMSGRFLLQSDPYLQTLIQTPQLTVKLLKFTIQIKMNMSDVLRK
jgi:hypothetical protein